MDAYLEEELYDLLVYCIQNRDNASDVESKKRIEDWKRAEFRWRSWCYGEYILLNRVQNKRRNWKGCKTLSFLVEWHN